MHLKIKLLSIDGVLGLGVKMKTNSFESLSKAEGFLCIGRLEIARSEFGYIIHPKSFFAVCILRSRFQVDVRTELITTPSDFSFINVCPQH